MGGHMNRDGDEDMRQGGAGLAGVDVVVLAGGLGSRIRPVLHDTPKVLAPIAGRPFLVHLLDRLEAAGAGRVILSLGVLADPVIACLEQETPRRRLRLTHRVEPRPLGTAGALGFVLDDIKSDAVMVMNGDTFIDADLAAFADVYRRSGADAAVLCVEMADTARFGRVEIGADNRIRRFVEKTPGAGIINAGVYMMSAAFITAFAAANAVSLERDVLESAPPGTLCAHVVQGRFVDIGTPESLATAESVVYPCAG